MPRRILKKVLPDRHTLLQRWFMRPFATAVSDPIYWSIHRRGVLRAFALGVFICFIPLPIHLLLAPVAAIALRANVPVTLVTTFLLNPLTLLPMFFTAYWVGAHLLGEPLAPFRIALDWDWARDHLTLIWKPFLLGCLVCGLGAAALAYASLSLIWRLRAHQRYRRRPGRDASARGVPQEPSPAKRVSSVDKDTTLER